MWKRLDKSSKELIDSYTKGRFTICDFSFTNLYLWSVGEKLEYREDKDVLTIRGYYHGDKYYFMPIPKEESPENLRAMKEVLDEILGEKAPVGYFSEHWKNLLEEEYEFEAVRDSFDYIYEVESLAYLKGRKYAKKKNRISQFQRRYPNFSVEKITSENIAEVKQFQYAWCKERECEKEEILRNENIGILYLLEDFEDLGLQGSLLRVENKIVGFSLGEALTEDYVVVHVEKALIEYVGSYQILNSYFLQQHFLDYPYVNREDDFGNEGLREAKESYHPAYLLTKYDLVGKR